MPLFTVNTNVKDIPQTFKTQATEVISKSLGKPVAYIAVHVNSGQDLIFGGTNEPAAVCDLVSIGALSVESNKKHSKALMDLMHKELKVDASRIYISFHNTPKGDIGYNGTTFDDLM